jgi:hypothetical protein
MSWSGPSFQTYYAEVPRMVQKLLERETPEYLLAVDFEEYLAHLISEIAWQPLEWDSTGMTIAPIPGSSRYQLRVPVSSHPQRHDYFQLRPSLFRTSGEPAWKFEGNTTLLIELDISNPDAADRAVERILDEIDFWIGGRNRDIEQGNRRLREVIEPIWKRKWEALEQQHGTSQSVLQKLNIPLHRDPNAPVKPVEIKSRRLRGAGSHVPRPEARTQVEPALDRDDVLSLVTFIEQYAQSFEISPRPYAKMDEEELRDLLVGMLNVNYPDRASGETFRKLGKADITLHVESGHVLIAECKFWKGAQGYREALHQLFGYLTWRETYGVLITFSQLKELSRAVTEARRITSEDATYTDRTLHSYSDTRFATRHRHPQDIGKSVEVHHLFFDLSF